MTPYQYVNNNPVNMVDPTGMEGQGWRKNLATGEMSYDESYTDENTPAGYEYRDADMDDKYYYNPDGTKIMTDNYMYDLAFGPEKKGEQSCIECHHKANIGDINLDVSPYTQGTLNVISGTLGTVGAATYVIGTEGVGVAFGGATALTLSIGQISLGVSQISDAWKGGNNKVLQASGSIPGYGARLMSSPYADHIDAGSNLLTTHLGTAGGLKAAVQNNVKGIVKGQQLPKNSYELFDTGKATQDLINAKKTKK